MITTHFKHKQYFQEMLG